MTRKRSVGVLLLFIKSESQHTNRQGKLLGGYQAQIGDRRLRGPGGFGSPYSFCFGDVTLIEYKLSRNTSNCGWDVTLNIREGAYSDSVTFSMVTAKFGGRLGLSLVMVAGLTDDWDSDSVEAFIQSIQ